MRLLQVGHRETTEKSGRNKAQTEIKSQQQMKYQREAQENNENKELDSRAGEGHQGSTDHDEVKDVPQVTEIRARVKEEA